MSKVLVLLATYNGANWLREQLDSLLNQKDVSCGLAWLDDYSTDDTKRILLSYKDKFESFECLGAEEKYGTAGGSFQHLIRSANIRGYDYVAFCDQDDVWCAEKLKKQIDVLEREHGDLCSTAVTAFGESKLTLLKQSVSWTKFDFLFEGAGQGCTFLMSKKFYLELQIIAEKHRLTLQQFFYHDWFAYLVLRVKGYKWCYLDHSTILYRQHSGNETGLRYSLNGIVRRFSALRNGWYWEQVRCAISIASTIGMRNEDFTALKRGIEARGWLARLRFRFLLLRISRRKILDRLVLFFLLKHRSRASIDAK